MFIKIYEWFKKLFRENYKLIIFAIVFFIVLEYPVPYYIFTNGGISDLSERFTIENGYTQEGSYNLSYVSQINGNILTYLSSYLVPSWDRVLVENYQLNENESIEELLIRDKLSLDYANQLAITTAYSKAGIDIEIKKSNVYIVYMTEYLKSDVQLKIGDQITHVNGNVINSFDEVISYVTATNDNDKVSFTIKRGNDTFDTDVLVQTIDDKKLVGISCYVIHEYETNPKITFNFSSNESGASAGLMTTLAIYDTLIEEDLTHGLKIAGTGTINSDGSIGEIGGVKYKLKGAVSSDADIFFVPTGDNYEECLKLVKDNDYKIDLVEVKTFDDAVNYLKDLKV